MILNNKEYNKDKEKWILQFCHSYYEPFADCARQYNALFKDTNYKVCTVYLTGKYNADIINITNADKVIFLELSKKQVRGLKLQAIFKLRLILKQYNFKYIIAHRFKPVFISLLASNLPVIAVHHAFNDYKNKSRRLFIAVINNILKKRLYILGVSDAVRDNIRTSLPNFNHNNIQTLYNRINLPDIKDKILNRQQARIKLKLNNDAFIIGNVGRLHQDKDQVTLIKAFALSLNKLPINSLLVIIGCGKLEQQLKQLTADLNISKQVLFLGKVPNAYQYFAAFDIFALTSDSEPFGMVLLEAMAADVPIICSNCGGGKEVAAHEVLFKFADVDDLSSKLIWCSENRRYPYQTKSLERFTDGRVRQDFYDVLNKFTLHNL